MKTRSMKNEDKGDKDERKELLSIQAIVLGQDYRRRAMRETDSLAFLVLSDVLDNSIR